MHVIAILVVLFAMLGVSGVAFAQGSPWVQGTPRFLAIPGGNPEQAMAESVVGANVPLFTNHFIFNAQQFNYTMVGTDPANGSATSRVKVRVIPLKFVFAGGLGGSLSAKDLVCGDTQTAASRTEKSPLFKKQVYTPGGINVGTVNYIDAFQRANFWNFVSTTAPNYHVKLKAPARIELPLQTINVPANQGGSSAGPCAHIGQVDINFFDSIAQGLITSLGIPSNELPLFLSYNTFWTDNGCCILGYHSVTPGNQTYAVGAYSDPGIFQAPNIQDIHALSHELAEWLDDPFVNNIVPAWGHIGQQSGCQDNLEVGDPVTGNGFNQVFNGKTFHPEDLVFLSWFARDSPSKAVAGFYSFTNSVGPPQGVCH
jgi:hypothetical protein